MGLAPPPRANPRPRPNPHRPPPCGSATPDMTDPGVPTITQFLGDPDFLGEDFAGP